MECEIELGKCEPYEVGNEVIWIKRESVEQQEIEPNTGKHNHQIISSLTEEPDGVPSESQSMVGRKSGHETLAKEKPFQCNICSFRFSLAGNLNRHMLSHNGEKPFQCEICSFRFNRDGDLKRHLLSHTGVKPFHCKICPFECHQAGNLKQHMLTHTREKPFHCKLCRFKCNRASDLKRHMYTHSADKPFQCDQCSYKCIEKKCLTTHMVRKHSGQVK